MVSGVVSKSAQITGWGYAVPGKVVTNDDLAKTLDTSDEWIRTRTGIRQRYIATPRETTFTLALKAARQALEVADFDPARLDLVIVATVTPDYPFPSTACLIQDALGARTAGAFDLSAGCSGFVYGLAIATQFIKAGTYKTILVIGAETLSRIVDWTDRSTCVLFGDGAGAVVLQASDQPGGVLSTVLGADGSGGDLLQLPGGGSRYPPSVETLAAKMHYAKMDGNAVFRFATRIMGEVAAQATEQAGLSLDQISLLIPHQANIRIIETAAKRLKLPPERVFTNLDRYGNTSSASIPIALCEAVEAGRVQPGDHLILVAFGAGLTWAAAAVRWGVPKPIRPRPWWKRLLSLLRAIGARIRSLAHYVFWVGGGRLPGSDKPTERPETPATPEPSSAAEPSAANAAPILSSEDQNQSATTESASPNTVS